jgi:hypothetical protein
VGHVPVLGVLSRQPKLSIHRLDVERLAAGGGTGTLPIGSSYNKNYP